MQAVRVVSAIWMELTLVALQTISEKSGTRMNQVGSAAILALLRMSNGRGRRCGWNRRREPEN